MLGVIFLGACLFFALSASIAYGASDSTTRYGRIFTYVSALAAVAASVFLMVLIFTNRFDIAYVASYSSKDLPTIYKISAFWAGQQGSFLLWLFIHAVAGCILVFCRQMNRQGLAAYLLVQALLVILVLGKSPFLPQEVAVQDGMGLNPLLQDPWMAVHPPVIFVGYALLAVPFSYSMGALLAKQPISEWLERARKWTLIAWSFLGAGIFIGGYWAYKVLGWGGYWGWDPVENSSLVPWLLTGVLLHLMKVARVRQAALAMVHLAAIFSFSVVVYGTFLARSGILGDFSVHSFAGTSIGLTIALVNALLLLGGLVVLTLRAGSLPTGSMYPSYNSREFVLLLGALLLVFASVIVFLGMSMPLLTQLAGQPAAVDTSFYVKTLMPLAILLMLVLVCACIHRYGDSVSLPRNRVMPALIVFFVLGGAAAFFAGVHEVLPIVLAASALMGFAASAASWHGKAMSFGGLVTHAGACIGLFAIVLSGSGSQTVSHEFTPNEPVELFGHTIVYNGQRYEENSTAKYYVYTVDGREVTALTKLHNDGADAAREPAIDKTLFGDVYLAPTPPKAGESQEYILKHGAMTMDEDYAYRYSDIDIEKTDDGRMVVTAEIEITDGNTVERAHPQIIATADGGNSHPVDIYDGAKRIRLTGVSGDQRQIRFEVLPSLEVESQQPVTASVSTKPFIWILWVSCVLTTVGCLIAIRKK